MKLECTNKFLFVCFVFLLITIGSCLDEVDFDVPSDFQNSTTILARLIKGNPSVVDVRLQRLFDFSFPQEQWLNATSVKLKDKEGNSLDIPLLLTGRYYLELSDEIDFEVEVGNEYALELCLFDGQCFESSYESLMPVPEMKEVNEKVIQKEIVNLAGTTVLNDNLLVSINTPTTPISSDQPANMRWEYLFTFKITDDTDQECYINGIYTDQLVIYQGMDLSATFLDSFTLLDFDINQLQTEGYHLTIIQEALSSGALDFYEQVEQLSFRNGTFYDPAPGLLTTNFRSTNDVPGKVLGYFYATEHDTITTFIDSTITQFYTTNCPKTRPDCPDECCDCLEVENSTLKKPFFWPN